MSNLDLGDRVAFYSRKALRLGTVVGIQRVEQRGQGPRRAGSWRYPAGSAPDSTSETIWIVEDGEKRPFKLRASENNAKLIPKDR